MGAGQRHSLLDQTKAFICQWGPVVECDMAWFDAVHAVGLYCA